MKSFVQYLDEIVQFDKYEPATYNKIEDKPNNFTYHNYAHDDGSTHIMIQQNHKTDNHHVVVSSQMETQRKGSKGKHAVRDALEFRDRTAQTLARHDATHRPKSYSLSTSTAENKKKWANKNSKANMFGRIMKSISKHTNQEFKTTEKAHTKHTLNVKHTRVTKK